MSQMVGSVSERSILYFQSFVFMNGIGCDTNENRAGSIFSASTCNFVMI